MTEPTGISRWAPCFQALGPQAYRERVIFTMRVTMSVVVSAWPL